MIPSIPLAPLFVKILTCFFNIPENLLKDLTTDEFPINR